MKDDTISRQAAIELIERMKSYHQDADDIAEMIANMPSAQPERKNGRWVKHDTGHSIYYDCSLCGCVAPCTEVSDSFIWKLSTYCPDCGAKMGKN